MPKPYIINHAGTGMVPTRGVSPHVPLTHSEIVDDVAACLELGVQMIHLHARTSDGTHTGDPEPYGRLIEAIRKLPGGREAVLTVTTSGRNGAGFDARARVLDLDGAMKPDMASLTLSSLNFANQASINDPKTIRALASRMLERGILPEVEIFDLGMVNFLHILIKEGLLPAPHYANLLLGNIAGAQANDLQLAALRLQLPTDCIVSIAGIGRHQLSANTLGLLFADGVRIGLEDNLWFDTAKTVPASNPALICRIHRIAGELERPLESRSTLRQRLGLSHQHVTNTPATSADEKHA